MIWGRSDHTNMIVGPEDLAVDDFGIYYATDLLSPPWIGIRYVVLGHVGYFSSTSGTYDVAITPIPAGAALLATALAALVARSRTSRSARDVSS